MSEQNTKPNARGLGRGLSSLLGDAPVAVSYTHLDVYKRQSLRSDNADQRLTQLGIDAGIVKSHRETIFNAKMEQINNLMDFATNNYLTPNEAQKLNLAVRQDGRRRNIIELLTLPNVSLDLLKDIYPELNNYNPEILEQLEIESIYHGYMDRQKADIETFTKDENVRIPDAIDYWQVGGLSAELAERLANTRPHTIGQALSLIHI